MRRQPTTKASRERSASPSTTPTEGSALGQAQALIRAASELRAYCIGQFTSKGHCRVCIALEDIRERAAQAKGETHKRRTPGLLAKKKRARHILGENAQKPQHPEWLARQEKLLGRLRASAANLRRRSVRREARVQAEALPRLRAEDRLHRGPRPPRRAVEAGGLRPGRRR